jgi:hypothetical protein
MDLIVKGNVGKYQHEIIASESTSDQIFNLRQIVENWRIWD